MVAVNLKTGVCSIYRFELYLQNGGLTKLFRRKSILHFWCRDDLVLSATVHYKTSGEEHTECCYGYQLIQHCAKKHSTTSSCTYEGRVGAELYWSQLSQPHTQHNIINKV